MTTYLCYRYSWWSIKGKVHWEPAKLNDSWKFLRSWKRHGQIQDAQRTPNHLNWKKSSPRHIVIKFSKVKDKERIQKTVTEKQQVTYKGKPIILASEFSVEILQARREWEYYIQWSYPLKVKEKENIFQISKNWEHSLLPDKPYK